MPDLSRYIEQLISDIHGSMRSAGNKIEADSPVDDEESFRKHIEAVEEYLYGEWKKISSISGIDRKSLPEPGQLDQNQQASLAVALEELLHHYHFFPDFPDAFPDHMKYSFLRNIWDDKHPYLTSGESHIEFCNYDPENCPFPDHCKACEEFEARFEEEEREKNYITSIFNYCDRWCERCEFTERCRNYDSLNEPMGESDPEDEMKKFQKELAAETDTIPESLYPSDSNESPEEKEDAKLSSLKEEDKDPIAIKANNYSLKSHAWLMRHYNHFESMEARWEANGMLETNREALAVVGYYCLFIAAKIRRAVSGMIDSQGLDDDYPEACEYDMNGSAKIALMTMDRSLASWQILQKNLPAFQSGIDYFMQLLIDLREDTERQFPEARKFIRPGFDE